jgi:hypothetical protein
MSSYFTPLTAGYWWLFGGMFCVFCNYSFFPCFSCFASPPSISNSLSFIYHPIQDIHPMDFQSTCQFLSKQFQDNPSYFPIYWSISSRKKFRTSSRYVHAVQPWKANVTWHNHNLRAWTCTKKRALTVWIPDMCCHCTTYVSRWTVRWPLFAATKQKQTTPPFKSPRAQSPKVGI